MIGIGYAVSREIYLGSFAVFRKMFGSYLSISTKFTHTAGATCSGYSAILNDHCDFFYLPI